MRKLHSSNSRGKEAPMLKASKVSDFMIAVVTAVIAGALLLVIQGSSRTMPALARQATEHLEQGKPPIADYSPALPSDPGQRAMREARNSRYDKRDAAPIREMPLGIEELPINSHWWACIPAIPSVKSDLIAIGTIADAHAYLSNDRTGLYSEFTVHVDEILKSTSPQAAAVGSDISVERPGGAIRFPSGRVQERQRQQGQGMPLIGNRYLFFLRADDRGQSFSVLTGYRFHSGKVSALDRVDQYASFDNTDGDAFLALVREAVAHPTKANEAEGGLCQ